MTKNRGFTIIEVALVLAIAGLIFLVVFLALPALQRGQRDNARRQEVQRIVSALESYLVDNNGHFPSALPANFIDNIKNNAGAMQQIDDIVLAPATIDNRIAVITVGSTCDNSNNLVSASASLNAAVQIRLESGGSGQLYCKSM